MRAWVGSELPRRQRHAFRRLVIFRRITEGIDKQAAVGIKADAHANDGAVGIINLKYPVVYTPFAGKTGVAGERFIPDEEGTVWRERDRRHVVVGNPCTLEGRVGFGASRKDQGDENEERKESFHIERRDEFILHREIIRGG